MDTERSGSEKTIYPLRSRLPIATLQLFFPAFRDVRSGGQQHQHGRSAARPFVFESRADSFAHQFGVFLYHLDFQFFLHSRRHARPLQRRRRAEPFPPRPSRRLGVLLPVAPRRRQRFPAVHPRAQRHVRRGGAAVRLGRGPQLPVPDVRGGRRQHHERGPVERYLLRLRGHPDLPAVVQAEDREGWLWRRRAYLDRAKRHGEPRAGLRGRIHHGRARE
mmetsp:Transcript_21789/g.54935  ORF Transcript_21789/g.54935 Transcript_21789/m.54935 type:complete len:219 (+) Transcript_21789:978-1634(+)